MIRMTTLALLALASAAAPAIAKVSVASAPTNECAKTDSVATAIDALNEMLPPPLKNAGISIVDASDITTIQFDDVAGKYACHMTIEFSDGNRRTGLLTQAMNAAGRWVTRWRPDAYQARH